MGDDGFGTTLKVLLNSLAFFILLILGGYMFTYEPVWGFVILFSAFDQLEDVYFYVAKRRLIPAWFTPIDIILEGVLALIGVSMFIFGMIYWYTFESWFFALWMAVSAMIAWSAVEDIVDDVRVISERMKGATVVGTVKDIDRFRFFGKIR